MLAWTLSIAAAALLAVPVPSQDPGAKPDLGHAGDDVVGVDAKAWQPHRATKVLYAGSPNGSREAAFRAFLERHFDKVGVIDIGKLSTKTAAGFDVVVADWTSQYGKDGYPAREDALTSAPVTMPDQFGIPVIAMDYVSTNLRSQRKLDWL